MISIEQQQKLLLNIANRLKSKINVYAIGGTAMMFLGFKESTLDIDLVFENENDKNLFKEIIKSLDYREMSPVKVYGVKRFQPEMLSLGDIRFDMFVLHVIDFIFSESMRKRANKKHQFGEYLILNVADPHDIILMKCATDRLKDKDDARRIINNTKINWQLLIDEAKIQIKLGKERAAFDLGDFLEHLKNKMKVNVPQEILDKIYDIVMKQAEEKKRHFN